MSEFKIEPGIPLPSSRRSRYPWADMMVGDSFFVSEETPFVNVVSAASATQRKLRKQGFGTTFIARRVPGGTRVWRTK
jgi:hypothetical protein